MGESQLIKERIVHNHEGEGAFTMYREIKNDFSKHLDFFVVDMVSLTVALLIVFSVQYYCGKGLVYNQNRINVFFILIGSSAFVAFVSKNYHHILKRNLLQEFQSVLGHMAGVAILAFVLLLLGHSLHDYTGREFLYFTVCCVVFEYTGRINYKRLLSHRYSNIENYRSILVVTEAQRVQEVLSKVTKNPICNYKVTGVVLAKGHDGQDYRTAWRICG